MKRKITAAADNRMTINEAFTEFYLEKKSLNRAAKTLLILISNKL